MLAICGLKINYQCIIVRRLARDGSVSRRDESQIDLNYYAVLTACLSWKRNQLTRMLLIAAFYCTLNTQYRIESYVRLIRLL